MEPLVRAVLITWERNASYALRLVDGLPPERWTAQPPGLGLGIRMNHPAWVFAHLGEYAQAAVNLCGGKPIDDPGAGPFGKDSASLDDPAAYPPPALQAARWEYLHRLGAAALRELPAARLDEPTPIERWRAKHPHVGDMIVMLMVKHESGHLGQLSAWRRAMGLTRVDM